MKTLVVITFLSILIFHNISVRMKIDDEMRRLLSRFKKND